MATRAAIASKDRVQRDKENRREMHQREKELKQKYSKQQMEHVTNSANAAGNILKGIAKWNDPDWYKKFKVTETMAKVPTFFRTGIPLAKGWLFGHTNSTESAADNLPGVITYRYVPTLPNGFSSNVIGNVYYKSSPINATLTRFMAELRKLNSRIGDYDPSDVGYYMYSLSDIMEDILITCKAIKIYNTWYAENANYAKVMLKAAGFDPDDFIANYNEYKAYIIKSIQQFNSSAVLPKSMSFLLRRAWLASVIVRDHDSKTAQCYMFNKDVTVTISEDETSLLVTRFSGQRTFTTFVNNLNSRMLRLFNSVGMVTITADLRAAFKPADLLLIPDLEPGAGILYSDSLTDLEQLHNLTTLPSLTSRWMVKNTVPARLYNLSINQDSEGNLYQGVISGGVVAPLNVDLITNPDANAKTAYSSCMCVLNNVKFLNFYKSTEIEEDDILESTRLRTVVSAFGDGSTTFNSSIILYCGTEVVEYGEVWVNDVVAGSIDYYGFTTDVVSNQFELLNEDRKSMLDRFDWLPCYRHTTYDGTNGYYNTFGEIDHPVLLSDGNLRWLHEGAAYSEFFVESTEFGQVRH